MCNVSGTLKNPGILPRVLDATFHHIGADGYEEMDLKPYLRNDAQRLGPDQVKQERAAKAAVFALVREVRSSRPGDVSSAQMTALRAEKGWNETLQPRFSLLGVY